MHLPFAARVMAKSFAVALLMLLGAALPASATTITATYSGTVSSGNDASGVFGSPGNLAGADYKLVFSINTGLGSYSTFNGTPGDPALQGDQLFGGISAILTINGHDFSFAGTSTDYDIAASKAGFGSIMQKATGANFANILVSLRTTNPSSGFPASVLTTASIMNCSTCTATMLFSSSSAYAWLNFSKLTIAATPIPATLPLLVSALGGLGFLGWRRQAAKAA
jgi:hypothetical protein